MKKRFGKRKLLTAVIAMLMALMMTFAGCATGPAGPKGDKGDQGIQGPAGPKGDKGDKGDSGKNEDTWTPSGDITESNIKATGTVSGTPGANGKYYADYATHQDAHEAARDLNIRIAEEGFVLLKNENNALPLSATERRVSTFGYRSTNLLLGGGGSGSGTPGSATDSYYKVDASTLQSSLEGAGFKLNKKTLNLYKSLPSSLTTEIDPDRYISNSVISTYGAYGDAAIVVIGRSGSEGSDLALENVAGHSDPTEHELQLTDNEVKTIKHVKKYFNKVIVLVNSSSPMQFDDLNAPKTADNLGVDAIVHIGQTGNDGIDAIGRILTGEVNPSGRTVDTWASDFKKNPTTSNFSSNIHNGVDNDLYLKDGTRLTYSSVEYREDIYVGYRYYETVHDDMNAEKAGSGDEWYEKNVEFPFGYGLSYTEFEWQLDNVKANDVISAANQTVTMRIRVKNIGNYAGKDVVEIYAHTPYEQFGIEKASQVLVGFAKTKLLQPGESDIVTVQFVAQDMASFDYADANDNGFKGYELEKGDYIISARRDSNTPVLEVTRTVAKDIKCETDYTTGEKIEAILSATEGVWANYNTVNDSLKNNLLSRTDITSGNIPAVSTKEDRTISQAVYDYLESQAHDKDKGLSCEDKESDPWYVAKNGIPAGWTQADSHTANNADITLKLSDLSGVSYTDYTINNGKVAVGDTAGDKLWEKYINQFTWEELCMLIEGGKLKDNMMNAELKKFGVGNFLQQDGPQQLKGNTNLGTVPTGARGAYYVGNVIIASTWNEDLVEEQGRMYGNDSIFLGVSGVYAPSMNTHRSPFSGRNFEYYSEDGVLAGKIAAAHVRGVVSKGAIVFIKHLFLNDQEYDRSIQGGVCTYVTEQAAREIYLKPFELAIKEGHANGIMCAFNRIGNVPAANNTALFTKVLRGEFGFRGYTMTDAWTDGVYIHHDAFLRAGTDAALRWMTPNNMEKGEWKDGMVYVSADGKKEANTVASPTQWAMVRRAAQHILYSFANSNDIKNGVSDTTTINLKLAKGMTGIDLSIFKEAIGTTDISNITFTDAKFDSENPSAMPKGLALSANGVLTGNTSSLSVGENTVYLTYKYDGFDAVKKAVINITVVEQAEIEVNGKLSVGQTCDATISSIRYAVGQPMSASIRGLAHGENETYGVANGTIETVKFSLAAGSMMPAGLTLNADGTITGTPTKAGSYDIIVRITSEGVVHGAKFSGTEKATQSNFFKFTLNVGAANENGSVEFKGEVVDNVSVVLTRTLNGMEREYAFVINTELLKDEKAHNRDFVIGVARTVRTPVNTRRDFVAFLTFKADGTFEIENAKVALISGSDIEKIVGTWKIEGAALTLTPKAGESYKGSVRVVEGAYTVPSDKQ